MSADVDRHRIGVEGGSPAAARGDGRAGGGRHLVRVAVGSSGQVPAAPDRHRPRPGGAGGGVPVVTGVDRHHHPRGPPGIPHLRVAVHIIERDLIQERTKAGLSAGPVGGPAHGAHRGEGEAGAADDRRGHPAGGGGHRGGGVPVHVVPAVEPGDQGTGAVSGQVLGDETKHRDYLMCAAVLLPAEVRVSSQSCPPARPAGPDRGSVKENHGHAQHATATRRCHL